MARSDSAHTEVTIDGMTLTSPVGLLAGNGSFPIEFAGVAREKGLEVIAVAHLGEADPKLASMVSHCEWIKVGALATVIKTFKRFGVKNAAFLGGIKRVNLFGGVALDMRAMAMIARIRSVKDDALLRGTAEELEREGIKVFSPHLLLHDSVPVVGSFSSLKPTADQSRDGVIGWDAAAALGQLDIGQTVVVSQGVVVAVEAVEGTDRCIERGCALGGPRCVVVKRSKPQQDLRLDLPSIGPETILTMQKGKASALVIEAGRTLILERERVVALADQAGIAIFAVNSAEDLNLIA